MPAGDSPAVARRRLRLALRKAREETGLTQGEVAERLEWSISKVNRIETGEVTISNTDLQALLRLLNVDDPDDVRRHLSDARAARRRGWWDEPRYRNHHTPGTLTLMQFEAEATEIRTFQIAFFPGLLQTRNYAASIIGTADDTMSDETKQTRLEARMLRQEILSQPHPPQLLVIIDEFLPQRVLGGPKVMADQLRATIDAIARPHVRLRILPKEEVGYLAMGAFNIYDLGNEDAVLYQEAARTDSIIDTRDAVTWYGHAFEDMWTASLTEDASLSTLEAQYALLKAQLDRTS